MSNENEAGELFIKTQEILDIAEALMRREVPATKSELEKLVQEIKANQTQQQEYWIRLADWVQKQMQPLAQLDEARLAERLAALLSQHLPTPAGLEKAGKQAALDIEGAFATGSRQSIQQAVAGVQATISRITATAEAATAALLKAIERIPQSVEVDYVRNFKTVATLVFIPLMLATLFYWGLGWFDGVSPAKYVRVLDKAEAAEQERDCYRQQIKIFRQEMKEKKVSGEVADSYFPPYRLPQPGQ